MSSHFFFVRAIVNDTESKIKPRNSILWTGISCDFSLFTVNPHDSNTSTVVLIWDISCSLSWHTRIVSSMYITIWIILVQSKAIIGWTILVKMWGADVSPWGKHLKLYKTPLQWKHRYDQYMAPHTGDYMHLPGQSMRSTSMDGTCQLLCKFGPF